MSQPLLPAPRSTWVVEDKILECPPDPSLQVGARMSNVDGHAWAIVAIQPRHNLYPLVTLIREWWL